MRTLRGCEFNSLQSARHLMSNQLCGSDWIGMTECGSQLKFEIARRANCVQYFWGLQRPPAQTKLRPIRLKLNLQKMVPKCGQLNSPNEWLEIDSLISHAKPRLMDRSSASEAELAVAINGIMVSAQYSRL